MTWWTWLICGIVLCYLHPYAGALAYRMTLGQSTFPKDILMFAFGIFQIFGWLALFSVIVIGVLHRFTGRPEVLSKVTSGLLYKIGGYPNFPREADADETTA